MKLKQLLFILLCAFFATNFYAADIYVSAAGDNTTGDGSQGNPYLTILKAVEVASDGDTIKIVGSITTTTGIFLSNTTPINLQKNLTFEGTDNTATLTGMSGSNRYFTINDFAYNKTLTFRNLIFLNNSSSLTAGGGVFFNNQSGATINFENCTFSGNSLSGGTVGGGSIYNSAGTISITDCTFLNNSSIANGGAIFINSGTVTITNSVFNTNTSVRNGGAINVANSTLVNITGSTFYKNSVSTTTIPPANPYGAGAIRLGNGVNNITNCTFFENTVFTTNQDYGAIRIENGTNIIKNSLFYNNKVDNGAGAFSDIGAAATGTQTFQNSIAQWITNNIDNRINFISFVKSTVDPLEVAADLTNSNLAWSPSLNKVTFTAPSLLSDHTPIDFGDDNSDVGSWDSKINLFKGTTDSDWAKGANWSSGAAPTALENVTLLSDSPTLVLGGSTNATINNLSVNAASSLTIDSGGVLIVNGTSTGNVKYNRELTFVSGNANGWHLVSSPVSGVTFNAAFVSANDIASGSGDNRGIAIYNSSGTPWTYLQATASLVSTAGVGYSMKRGTITGDVSFTGTINTSDVNGVTVSTAGNGFNLLGNPYTSFMSSQTFLNANTNLDTQIWTWTDAFGYEARTAASNFVLAPAQGFFVKATSGTTVNFAESNQLTTGAAFQKSSSNNAEVNMIINDAQISRKAQLIYYENNVTKGFDNGYEGELFGGVTHSLAIYSDLVSNSNGKKYQVQSLPIAEMETMIVPVGVKADAGKEITFTAEAMNLPGDVKVFLEDSLTNTFTRLDEANASYKVTLNDALNGTGRFFLHTKSSAVLSTDDIALQNTSIYAINNNTLRVVGLPSGNANVKMYSILGKQVMQTSFSSTGMKEISLPKLSTGMYIVQVETAAGKLNKKIVLE